MSTTQETAATPFGNSSRRTFLKWSGVAGGTATGRNIMKNAGLKITRRQRTAFLTAVASYMGGVL